MSPVHTRAKVPQSTDTSYGNEVRGFSFVRTNLVARSLVWTGNWSDQLLQFWGDVVNKGLALLVWIVRMNRSEVTVWARSFNFWTLMWVVSSNLLLHRHVIAPSQAWLLPWPSLGIKHKAAVSICRRVDSQATEVWWRARRWQYTPGIQKRYRSNYNRGSDVSRIACVR